MNCLRNCLYCILKRKRHQQQSLESLLIDDNVNHEHHLKELRVLRDKLRHCIKHVKPSNAEGLEDFKQVAVLGVGTFGTVYLVFNEKLNDFFALKILTKKLLMTSGYSKYANTEKQIMACANFPFIQTMLFSYKTKQYLYFVMPYIKGGDMFSHIRNVHHFYEDLAKFYASQIILALEFLHFCDYVYRDLKPENILIDKDGYIKLTDMGCCKYITGRTYSFCGTPEYLAPEVVLMKGYGKSVDWWSFGVLLYEMCAGYSPFRSSSVMRTFNNICNAKLYPPRRFSMELIDLLKNLLQVDLTRRLGNMSQGVLDIKKHSWFKNIDFNALYRKTLAAPVKPAVTSTISSHSIVPTLTENKSDSSEYEEEFIDF